MNNKGIALLVVAGIGATIFYKLHTSSPDQLVAPSARLESKETHAIQANSTNKALPVTPSNVASAPRTTIAAPSANAALTRANSGNALPQPGTATQLGQQISAPPLPKSIAANAVAQEAQDNANPFQGLGHHTGGDQVFLKPADSANIRIADASAAKALITTQGRDYFQLGSQDDVELKTTKRDALGNDFHKFQQTYAGLPVAGRELVVQAGPDKQLEVVAGQFQSGIAVNTTPSLTGARALDVAITSLQPTETPNVIDYPKLAVYVDDSTNPTLTYRAVVEFTGKKLGYHVDELYIDANTGSVVRAVPRLHSALSRELFDFKKQCLYSTAQLPGSSLPTTTTDSHAKSAYDNAGLTYWFYKNQLNRDSYDAKGITIRSTVHATFSTGTSCTGDNAFFSADVNQVVFGEGGTGLTNPAGALDIVAHELTHGVTANESNLTYQGESGAINEAISDIFGAAAETWVGSGGSTAGNPTNLTPTLANWTIGEKSANSTSYERFMYNPTADGHSKDYYPERNTGTSDSGGVHTNSGIMNLAFYLLSEGGKHPRKANGVQVSGVGFKKAMDIYYHSTTNLFTSSTNFQQARALLAQSAETLYGKCSAEWEAVEKSFDAVAVPGTWQACSGASPTPTTPTPTPAPAPSPSNLATGAIASASSVYSSAFGAANVNDGKASTAWNSRTIFSPYAQEWLMLNLKSVKTLRSANVKWSANGQVARFQMWVYQGGVWRLKADQITNGGSSSTVSLANSSAQYVIVTMIYGQPSKRYGIDEIVLN